MSFDRINEKMDIAYKSEKEGDLIDASEWNSNFDEVEEKFNDSVDVVNKLIDSINDGTFVSLANALEQNGIPAGSVQNALEACMNHHTNKSVLDSITSSDKVEYDRIKKLLFDIDSITSESELVDGKIPSSSTSIPTSETVRKAIDAKTLEVGSADMTKAVYDSNGDGIVDNSERLGGNPPEYYMEKFVPLNSVDTSLNIPVNSEAVVNYAMPKDAETRPMYKCYIDTITYNTSPSGEKIVRIYNDDTKAPLSFDYEPICRLVFKFSTEIDPGLLNYNGIRYVKDGDKYYLEMYWARTNFNFPPDLLCSFYLSLYKSDEFTYVRELVSYNLRNSANSYIFSLGLNQRVIDDNTSVLLSAGNKMFGLKPIVALVEYLKTKLSDVFASYKHTHSASDITKGKLSFDNGGLGDYLKSSTNKLISSLGNSSESISSEHHFVVQNNDDASTFSLKTIGSLIDSCVSLVLDKLNWSTPNLTVISKLVSDSNYTLRNYKYFKIVFMRFYSKLTIPSGSWTTIATVNDSFSPSMIHSLTINRLTNLSQIRARINGNGEIQVYSEDALKDSMVYITGFWFF